MNKYNPKDIEPKWQQYWHNNQTFKATENKDKQKFYSLAEFPYPSGAGLHVGHPRPYTAMDVISRKKRMEGYNVLFPIGFDAFGLPTENYAIKTGRPPAEVTAENIATFTRQLKSLGFSFDWSRAVDTTDPKYFKWTQWIFLQFYKAGLAYKTNQPINWCPKDKIGLANEEATGGICERCGTPVEKRNKEQWMIAITKYADQLLEGLKQVNYIPEARTQQENWIGKSEGAEVIFKLNVPGQAEGKHSVTVFTTRPDTIFGVTFLAISPELAQKWIDAGWQAGLEVKKYIEQTLKERALVSATREEQAKTGVAADVSAINPVSSEALPVWITNYVMGEVGTGALMGVPGHDERDFDFAKKFDLPIKYVVAKKYGPEKPDAERRDGVAAVLVKDNKVLVMYDKADEMYRLPAGGYEKNETPLETLKREIIEETGYTDFTITESLGEIEGYFYVLDKKVSRHKIQKGYVVTLDSDRQVPVSPEDEGKHDYYWLDSDEAIKRFATDRDCYGEEEFLIRYKNKTEGLFADTGTAVNSDFLNGLSTAEATTAIISWLEEQGVGKRQVNYKLRDWVFSRQRYWGEPIPLVKCESCAQKKYHYVIIHGYSSDSSKGFKPWLKAELEKQGHSVFSPDLPNADEPNVEEQVQYILKHTTIDENTVLIGHSLGGTVLLKLLEQIDTPVAKAVIVDAPIRPVYNDADRPAVNKSCDWKFDFAKIKRAASEFIVLGDNRFAIIPRDQLVELAQVLSTSARLVLPEGVHFSKGSVVEPTILEAALFSPWIPLPEDQLPLELPKVQKYEPTDTGESPLSVMTDWVNTTCPRCGGPAKRETDTMPNWAGSSWYFLRYCDPFNDKEFAGQEKLGYWTPVDWYNGGNEHTVLHLLYSRFWNQFLYDQGHVSTLEPYKKRTSHGIILAEDGEKMSKSRGNVINPDEMVDQFGADALRTYIMFMGPFDQAVSWSTNGLIGVRRFLDRVWNLQEKVNAIEESVSNSVTTLLHRTIKKVTADIDAMRFNTAIAALMELVNEMSKQSSVLSSQYVVLVKLLSPFAPHLTEELWQSLGNTSTISSASWPVYDEALCKSVEMELVIQINGKLRDTIIVSPDISEAEAKQVALASEKIQKWLDGKEPKKVIYVTGKLVSIVV